MRSRRALSDRLSARECYALGCLLGGADGEAQKLNARSVLASRGVANPDTDLRAYCPELFGVVAS